MELCAIQIYKLNYNNLFNNLILIINLFVKIISWTWLVFYFSIKLFSQIISLICYCFPLKDLCSHSVVQEDETLKKTCYLTQGALMHEYCKDKEGDCLNDKALVCISQLPNQHLTS